MPEGRVPVSVGSVVVETRGFVGGAAVVGVVGLLTVAVCRHLVVR
jgi:hypothetical protein